MEAELRQIILDTNASLDELRETHELLKKNHNRALEKLQAAEQRAIEAEAKQDQIQAEYRAVYQEWSNQLANQAQEFKNLESQMIPQHVLQMEKIKLGNELRVNFEKECSSLRKTIESIREELNHVKREAQNFRIQKENAVSEKDFIQARLSATISTLQEDLDAEKGHAQEVDDTNSQLLENIRVLESRIIDLTVSESHLKLAEEAARQDAEDAIRVKCQAELSHLRTTKELQSQCLLLQTQLECYQTQYNETPATKEHVHQLLGPDSPLLIKHERRHFSKPDTQPLEDTEHSKRDLRG